MPIKKDSKTQIEKQIESSSLQSQTTSFKLNEFIPRVRFNDTDKSRLEKYFNHKGLSLSSGVRMVLKEFMNDKNV